MNQEVKIGILDWVFGLIFIIVFSIIMLLGDIIQRVALLLGMSFQEKVYYFVNNSVVHALKIAGTKYSIENNANINSDLPLLVISNHQSLMDIAILNHLFSKEKLRFISKKSLAKNLPYVSSSLRNMKHGLIDRNNRNQAHEELERLAFDAKKDNFGICLFPEGTRARAGEMKDFKPGGVKILVGALEKVQIVAVSINNSWRLAARKLMPVPFGTEVKIKVFPVQIVSKEEDLKEIVIDIEQKIREEIHE